jgi:serine/threonine-protein kinase
MSLTIGAHLGHYEILEKLGEGGMGQVFRARDSRLQRHVAIKILPSTVAADPDRLARFAREAQVLASLNHPHIAQIYGTEEGSGMHALVMELVEGRTLADMIPARFDPAAPRSAQAATIELDDAIEIARQIAEALEAAHEQGIIHRDLKPANVKVRPDGTVKVLDFGLAKAMSGEGNGVPPGMDNSPTFTSPAAITQLGVILGTAGYMAPEQARGRAVDRRVDIWAFGCVLFEMLTGQPPFTGETVTDVISAVVSQEPEWTALPAHVPSAVAQLVRRCLQKDPRRRLRDIGEARVILEAPRAAEQMTTAAAPSPKGSWLQPVIWGIVLTLAGGMTVGVASIYFSSKRSLSQPESPAMLTRFDVEAPDPSSSLTLVFRPSVAVSANGRSLAFVAATGGITSIYVRRRSEPSAWKVPGSERGSNPALSPDGSSVVFFSPAQIVRAQLGGEPTPVVGAPDVRGISWTDNGMLVFTPDQATAIMTMPADGGTMRPLTTLAPGERTHRWPQALPGGKAVLFTVGLLTSPDSYDAANIDAVVTATGERRVVLTGSAMARYCGDGRLLFTKGAALYSIAFDPEQLKTSGAPVQVAPAVARDASTGAAHFDCARDGTLSYVPATSLTEQRQLFWATESGVMTSVKLPPGAYQDARISPDGRYAVLLQGPSLNGDVWVLELSSATLRRLTFNATNTAPVWSADGRTVYFTSIDAATMVTSVMKKPADGSREATALGTLKGRAYVDWVAADESSAILDRIHPSNDAGDIVRLTFGPAPSTQPLIDSPRNDFAGALSPNGRWLAYQSDETGRQEVHVFEIGGSGARWQVTIEGGEEPRWSRDSKQLFYRTSNRLMSVPLEPDTTFRYGRPRALFDGIYNSGIESGRSYDVDPRGGRFLLVRPGDTGPAPRDVRMVLNWPLGLSPP